MKELKGNRIGIIGMGRIGRCLVQGLLDSKIFSKKDIYFTTKHPDTTKRAKDSLGIQACKDNVELVNKANWVLVAVKPQNIGSVLEEISGHLKKDTVILSVVTGVSTQKIEEKCGKNIAVVRAMPNTPALVREGMTAICLGKNAGIEHGNIAKKLFESVGKVVLVDEKLMDGITGLSGSGPAYVYMILESLTEGGIKVGLPRDLATTLSTQTVLGAAKMLQETGKHPAALKDEVTTPAGCTIDGLTELEDGKLRITLMRAVTMSAKRAGELSRVTEL